MGDYKEVNKALDIFTEQQPERPEDCLAIDGTGIDSSWRDKLWKMHFFLESETIKTVVGVQEKNYTTKKERQQDTMATSVQNTAK